MRGRHLPVTIRYVGARRSTVHIFKINPGGVVENESRQTAYWRANLRLTTVLLVLWFLATFVMIFFARELATISLFGWPLSFYMAAQGSLLIYVLIVWLYARRMRRLDDAYQASEGAQ